MGRPKPLLPWQGKTLVEYQIQSLLGGGVDEVFVVTGKSDSEVAPIISNLPHVRRVHNPCFAAGKTTSIKAGIAALPGNVTAIVLLAVDQPRPVWVVRQVLESHIRSGAPLTSPRYEGHGGHPLIFEGSLCDELAGITEANQGIREVFQRHQDRMNAVFFDNDIIRLDLNTPDAYEAALNGYDELSATPE